MKKCRVSPVFAGFLLFAVGLFNATDVSAKQCVFNKGGYVLHVNWYHPSDLAKSSDERYFIVRSFAPPVLAQALTAGFSSCTATNESLVAIISVVGCIAIKPPRGYPDLVTCEHYYLDGSTHMSPSYWESAPAQSIQCRNASFDYCLGGTVKSDPPIAGTPVLIVEPPSTTYIDFWGGIANVEWGLGGPTE